MGFLDLLRWIFTGHRQDPLPPTSAAAATSTNKPVPDPSEPTQSIPPAPAPSEDQIDPGPQPPKASQEDDESFVTSPEDFVRGIVPDSPPPPINPKKRISVRSSLQTADKTKDAKDTVDQATGNRGPAGALTQAQPADTLGGISDTVKGEDVSGSLKIHIKLNLDVDIRVIAKIRGDIAIGIL